MQIIKSLKAFIQFLSDPVSDISSDEPLGLGTLAGLLLVVFIFSILIFTPIISLFGIEELNHKIEDLFQEFSFNIWLLFIPIVFIAPFIEEMIFRFPLRYPILSLMFSSFVMFFVIFMITGIKANLQYVMFIGLGMSLFVGLLVNRFFKKEWIQLYEKYYGIIFYQSVVIFAFVHIFNFELDADTWYLAPILVLPQFLLGLLLGYVRVRNNIWSSIFVHALNNLVPMTAMLLTGGIN